MYIDDFWQIFRDFYPFFDYVKKWAKNMFWQFLKNSIFSQKSDDLNGFLVKFPTTNVYFYILYFISYQATKLRRWHHL